MKKRKQKEQDPEKVRKAEIKKQKKKKRKSQKPRISMRLFYTLFITIELLIIDLIATFVVATLQRYSVLIDPLPQVIWLIIISTVLGSTLTTFMVKFIFDPMLKLGNAMSSVAQGDFTPELPTHHVFPEIRKINKDFNAMARELDSTEILKTEFISNVSHEFKTPINAIEGYATLLQGTDPSQPEEQKEYIDKILFNTSRLSKLVGNILLLSKVDNQGIQPKTGTFRLDEQIRQSILALEPKWIAGENEFDVNLESVEYTGNENLLMHVWNNLIENAIKYGPKQGLITIRMYQKDNVVTVTVDDEGPGISEEARQHIFDRFYQEDTSRKAEGNGLGLALVKRILAISDGSISAENLPEKGARFTVRLNLS